MRRSQFDEASQPVRNLFTNPSFETAAVVSASRINHFPNPAMESSSGTFATRTNLAINPSFEAASGVVNVRTNLATNPSFATPSSAALVRTNLCKNPNFELDLSGYTAANQSTLTRFASTAMSGSYVGRITFTDTTVLDSGLGFPAVTDWEPNTKYTVSMNMLSNIDRTVRFSAQGSGVINSGLSGLTLTAGQAKTLTWTFQTSTTAPATVALYVFRGEALLGTLDFDSVIIEKAPVSPGAYFDGSTPIQNLVPNPSADVNATGWGAKGSPMATIARDTGRAYTGAASMKVTMTTEAASQGIGIDVTGLIVGLTYTMSGFIFVPTGTQNVIATVSNVGYGSTVSAKDVWTRATMTFVASAATHNVGFDSVGNAQTGKFFYVDGVMLEQASTASPVYYSGAGDFTYAWLGAPNASMSVQRGMGVTTANGAAAGVVQSSGWLGRPTSARLVSMYPTEGSAYVDFTGISWATGVQYSASITYYMPQAQTVPGTVGPVFIAYWFESGAYKQTIMAQPQQTAATGLNGRTLSVSWTFPAGATGLQLRFRADSRMGDSDVWFDDFIVEQAAVNGPFFDGASPLQNLATNPSLATDSTNWASQWYGSTGAGTTVRSAGTGLDGGWSWRKSWTSAMTAAQDVGVTYRVASGITPGATYTFSGYMRPSMASNIVPYVTWLDNSGSGFANTLPGTPVTPAPANVWTRGSLTATAPAGTTGALFVWGPYGSGTDIPVGGTFHYDAVLIERAATLNNYYEGSGDYTYAWTGTTNASSSVQQAPRVVGTDYVPTLAIAYQSKTGSTSGSKSVRITPTHPSAGDSFVEIGPMFSGYTFKPNTTYTIAGDRTITAPLTNVGGTPHFRINIGTELTPTIISGPVNVTGTVRVIGRFTTGASTTLNFIRLYNGSFVGGGDVWWDNLTLEEGETTGSYFDGSKPLRNLIYNPSSEVDSHGYATNAGSGVVSASRQTSGGLHGQSFYRATWTTGTSAVTGYLEWGSLSTSGTGIVAGNRYSFSAYIRSSFATSVFLRANWWNGAYSTGAVDGTTVSLAANTWTRVGVTGTAPTGSTGVWLDWYPTTVIPTGGSIDLDGALAEVSPRIGPYYEGLGDFTYEWSGAVNASTSLQRAPIVTGFTSENGGKFYRDSTSRVMSGVYSGRMLPSSGDIYRTVSTTTVGQSWTLSLDYRSDGVLTGNPRLYIAGGGPPTMVSLPLDQQTTTRVSVTLPATAIGVTMVVAAIFAATTGEFWIDNVLLEQTSTALPYFDGSTPAAGDFTYLWTGTAHESASHQRAPGVSQIVTGNCWPVHSSEWAAGGGKSLRLTGINQHATSSALLQSLPLERGKTYTVMATRRLPAPLTGTLSSYAGSIISVQTGVGTFQSPSLPNVAGIAQARLTFKLAEDVTTWSLRLGHGGSAGSGDVWWDNVMVVEGDYAGDYINPEQNLLSKWDGAVNASTSIGYPPQLLDLAGNPAIRAENVSQGASYAVPDGPITVYTVQSLGQTTGNPGYWEISNGGVWTNPTAIARLIGSLPTQGRLDLIGTSNINTSVNLDPMQLAVTASALDQNATGVDFQWDGKTTQTIAPDAGYRGFNGATLRVGLRDSGPTGTVTTKIVLVYTGKHNEATRVAVSRYLGNKYGISVA